jgi:hypothetical protein
MSTPALEVPEFFPTQFGTNWEHLLQQEVSRLRETVKVDMDIRGKEKTFNQFGTSAMRKITSRNAQTLPSDRDDEKRWLYLDPYDEVTFFDEWDADILGDIALPDSEAVQSHAMAAGRTCDQLIIDAASSTTAKSGESGGTSNALASSNQILVAHGGANEGLTLGKLIAAKSIFGLNESYGQNRSKDDTLHLIISQAQIDDLLENVTEVKNSDYVQVKALQSGEVDNFMGFQFTRTELLTTTGAASTDIRTCLAYVKSGIVLGIGRDRSVKTTIRDDLNETLQIRTKMRMGATRLYEEKVVEIFCDESP